MAQVSKPKRLPRKRKPSSALQYHGAPLTRTTQAEMNAASAMTPERIRKVRASIISELRELLDAKVVE